MIPGATGYLEAVQMQIVLAMVKQNALRERNSRSKNKATMAHSVRQQPKGIHIRPVGETRIDYLNSSVNGA